MTAVLAGETHDKSVRLLTVQSRRKRATATEQIKMLAAVRITVVLAIAMAVANSACGQTHGARQTPSQVPRYTPQSPTVSPYVNLLNRNGGAVGNYYGLVRPLERQQAFNASQSQETLSHEQEIKNIRTQQQNFEQPTIKPTGTAGWFQNYGQTSPYQVASHYYSQWQPPKPQRRTASGRHF